MPPLTRRVPFSQLSKPTRSAIITGIAAGVLFVFVITTMLVVRMLRGRSSRGAADDRGNFAPLNGHDHQNIQMVDHNTELFNNTGAVTAPVAPATAASGPQHPSQQAPWVQGNYTAYDGSAYRPYDPTPYGDGGKGQVERQEDLHAYTPQHARELS